jgi:hypothetical protein
MPRARGPLFVFTALCHRKLVAPVVILVLSVALVFPRVSAREPCLFFLRGRNESARHRGFAPQNARGAAFAAAGSRAAYLYLRLSATASSSHRLLYSFSAWPLFSRAYPRGSPVYFFCAGGMNPPGIGVLLRKTPAAPHLRRPGQGPPTCIYGSQPPQARRTGCYTRSQRGPCFPARIRVGAMFIFSARAE